MAEVHAVDHVQLPIPLCNRLELIEPENPKEIHDVASFRLAV